MKFFLIGLTLLTSTSSFADSREEYGFVDSPKNVEIAKEIKSRLLDGHFAGVTNKGRDCSVEIEGTSITIKNSDFLRISDTDYDCLQETGVACFEFSTERYLPQKTWFFYGDLFSAKVKTHTENRLHLSTKRNLGGSAKYELILSSQKNKTSIHIIEQIDSTKRELDCNIYL